MLSPVASTKFRKDVDLLKKQGKDLNKLRDLLDLLINEKPLPERYVDHPLSGNWAGYRGIIEHEKREQE